MTINLDIQKDVNNNISFFDFTQFATERMGGSMLKRKGEWIDDYYYTLSSNANDVMYRINKKGFRTNNFKKIEKKYNKLTILSSGCSFGFGQDMPEEFRYSNMVAQSLRDKYEVDEYNLGLMSASIHLIIKNIFTFFNNYGNPDILLITFPDMHRGLFFNLEQSSFIETNLYSVGARGWIRDTLIDWKKNYLPHHNLVIYTTMIHMLDEYCKANNILFLWTFWEEGTKNTFDFFSKSYHSYFNVDTLWPHLMEKDYGNHDIKYWQNAGDGAHPGGGWNKEVADKMLEIIKSKLSV
jgi:hypothetical protein